MAKGKGQSLPAHNIADVDQMAMGATVKYFLLDEEGGVDERGTRKVPAIVQHAYKDGRRGPLHGGLLVHLAIFAREQMYFKDVEFLANAGEPGTCDTLQEGDLT